MSNSSDLSNISGRQVDEFNCFHIKDFEAWDSIRVNMQDGSMVRGVVSFVDYESNLIIFSTKNNINCYATVDDIVSLEEHRSDWLV